MGSQYKINRWERITSERIIKGHSVNSTIDNGREVIEDFVWQKRIVTVSTDYAQVSAYHKGVFVDRFSQWFGSDCVDSATSEAVHLADHYRVEMGGDFVLIVESFTGSQELVCVGDDLYDTVNEYGAEDLSEKIIVFMTGEYNAKSN